MKTAAMACWAAMCAAPQAEVLLACDFESEDWWQAWGEKKPPSNVSLVEGESAFGGRGKSLKVTIPKGTNTGANFHTPGKEGGPGEKDGILRGWIDGQPAYEKTDLRFRDVDSLKIETVWVNVYHGGTTPTPEDLHLYLDNMVISRKPIGPVGKK